MNAYMLKIQNIEKMIAAENDPMKKWRYGMILKETLLKIEKITA